jgi:hypothetical protein
VALPAQPDIQGEREEPTVVSDDVDVVVPEAVVNEPVGLVVAAQPRVAMVKARLLADADCRRR